MTVRTINDLFIQSLRDIYDAERQLTKALPKLAKAASDQALKEAFTAHLEETKGQIQRLEQIFEMLDMRTRGKPCEAMKGLVEESREEIEEIEVPELLDCAMIVGAQKVEHYEIAAYGSLIAFAKALGLKDAVKLLSQTLDEEKAADQKLYTLAVEGGINDRAVKIKPEPKQKAA